MPQLNAEVDAWLNLVNEYRDNIAGVSVAVPGVIPGSRMYYECYTEDRGFRAFHRELIPCRKTTEFFVQRFTEVSLEDVDAAVAQVRAGITQMYSTDGSRAIKFGGHVLGGSDPQEKHEKSLLRGLVRKLG